MGGRGSLSKEGSKPPDQSMGVAGDVFRQRNSTTQRYVALYVIWRDPILESLNCRCCKGKGFMKPFKSEGVMKV